MSREDHLITRREAVQRVVLMLGGVTLVGGSTLLSACEREQKAYSDARERAARRARGLPDIPPEARTAEAYLPDQRKEAALGTDVGAATAITADSPAHYFRMMKELALLGYFTSEIGCTQAQRYIESPARYDPCVPYKPGEKAWAPHA